MAFLVEDETGLAAANSYTTVAEFKVYHDDRGNDYQTKISSDVDIQRNLILATDYIEGRWRFKGTREFGADQGLSFPRSSLYDREGRLVSGLPAKLKNATSEYALRVADAPLYTEPTTDASGLRKKRTKIGPIEVEFMDGDVVKVIRAYPLADRMLQEYVVAGGGVQRG